MEPRILATDDIVTRYFELFVNRKAYTVQSSHPNSGTGRCYYYRPKGRVCLSKETIRMHLEGRTTIGLYAINPVTQRCKWVAIDADYLSALDDLLKLQWELRRDGVDAALKVPVKAAGLADGIEVFPKQNEVPAHEFGNAIRGPLGVHRGAGKRYWFYGADYTLEAQTAYLERLKRITEDEMVRFVDGLEVPQELAPFPKEKARPYVPSSNPNHREFRIRDHVTVRRRAGRNYWARCPSCAGLGRDRSADNLAISISDPRKYKCWAGCTKEQIRAALGRPIRSQRAG